MRSAMGRESQNSRSCCAWALRGTTLSVRCMRSIVAARHVGAKRIVCAGGRIAVEVAADGCQLEMRRAMGQSVTNRPYFDQRLFRRLKLP